MALAEYEADKIRICLANCISFCKDGKLRSELQHAFNSITWKPVELYLCRCVRADGALPLTFFGLCATYTIVILQFANVSFDSTDSAPSVQDMTVALNMTLL
ncbi:hypothetical protein O0L34_g13844 [Tuta absoluta]|nr:hypothetical protein O0L34_g13844 [Tuta absoluta]